MELGLERAGLGPVAWQVEIDPFCRRVLAKHWPEVKQHDDIRRVGAGTLARVDLICGGFPCQDVSGAGLGAGLTGARSGLWFEFRRVVEELHPQLVVVENVTSGARRWLCVVRDDLRQLGYRTRALGIAAIDVGAPHRRRRVFVLAADPDRFTLREQSRRGETRTGSTEPRCDRAPRALAHADGCRPLYPWTAEPNVGRVAHGVSARLDRLKALGNAVVPQCAEVAGLVLRQWIGT